MRIFSWTLPWLAVFTASTAWGQYGLYGSPEVLRLPPMAQPAQNNNMPPAVDPSAPSVIPWQAAPSVSAMPAPPCVQTAAVAPAAQARLGQSGAAPMVQAPIASGPNLPTPVPTQRTGVVDQMLQQAYPGTGSYAAAPNEGCAGGCGSVSGPACQFAAAACSPCCECQWYGETSLLWMTRNTGNRVYTTYETDNNPNQLMNTDVEMGWEPGGEIRFGRRFCCGQYAVEGVFWGLGEFNGTDSRAMAAPGVSTPLSVDGIEFGGVNAQAYFDGAGEHRLWRRSEMYNAEVNFLRTGLGSCDPCGCNPLRIDCLAGFRYIRFTDQILFGSLQQGATWGGNGGLNEAYLNDRISNDLFGFQVGLDGSYQIAPKWRLFCNTKVGIFENHIQNSFDAFRGDGTVANPTTASGMSGTYPVRGSADAVSFMTEIKFGLHWNFWQNWGAQVGYRVMAVTDVGMPDSQIPFYVVDIPELMNVKHNGDLIVHGGFAGVTWNF